MIDKTIAIIILFCLFAFIYIVSIFRIRQNVCKNCPHRKICDDLEANNQQNLCEQSDNMINKCQDLNYL